MLFCLEMPVFIFCPVSTNIVIKKRDYKQDIIISVGSSCIKIIFALLAEPEAIQMQFIEI